MRLINWWEIGEEQYITLTRNYLEKLNRFIILKFGSLYKLSKILGIPAPSLYNKFADKNQSMCVSLLKNILSFLNQDFSTLDLEIESLGIRDGIKNPKFPIIITSYFSELIANGFFDGYASKSIFRYSNYDIEIRNEFITLIRMLGIGTVKINNPTNVERDIDLPDVIPKLLMSTFDIKSFYSRICRIPETIYNLTQEDELYSWFFIKAAYLDEGTITGGQIFLVRGVVNYELVEDLQKLCSIAGLRTEIKERNPKRYSLLVREESYPKLYKIFIRVMWNKCDKVEKLLRKIKKWKKIKRKQVRYKRDLKLILRLAKTNQKITNGDVMNLCNVAENTARSRLCILTFLGNLKKTKRGKVNEFTFISDELRNIPKVNDIRRLLGWR